MRYLVFALLLFQDPHQGQPKTCDNYHDTKNKCECHRAKECPDGKVRGEDPKCQVYCRKNDCKCVHPCTT